MNNEVLNKSLVQEFEYSSTLSSGAGGQNIQKTKSAVWISWSPGESQSLNEHQMKMILDKLKNHINAEGKIRLKCDEQRDQIRNKMTSQMKMLNLIHSALKVNKVRKKTKPSRSQKMKRLESKKRAGQRKKERSSKHF